MGCGGSVAQFANILVLLCCLRLIGLVTSGSSENNAATAGRALLPAKTITKYRGNIQHYFTQKSFLAKRRQAVKTVFFVKLTLALRYVIV